MKTLYLFVSRIRQYYVRNKVIFLLFMIGGVLNAITLAFCYGNALPSILNRETKDPAYREYFVYYDQGQLTEEDLFKFLNHPLIQACSFDGRLDSAGTTAVVGDYPLTLIEGTLEFTGPYQILMPMKSGLQIGDTFQFLGEEFETIGIIKMPTSLQRPVIPYDTFLSLCGGVENTTGLYFYSTEVQQWENDLVLAWAAEALPFSNSSPVFALFSLYADANETAYYLPLICITTFLGVFAFTVLLYNMIKSAAKENIISMIVGASKVRVAIWSFAEALILGVSANILGFLLHWALYQPVFTKLNLATHLTYYFEDYCLLTLMILIFSLITTLPVLFKQLRLSPIAARRSHM